MTLTISKTLLGDTGISDWQPIREMKSIHDKIFISYAELKHQ